MFSNKFAFIAVGAACIAAAGAGGYLASRQNATPINATAVTAERPVQETEAVVGDIPPAIAPAVAPSPSPTLAAARPAKRNEMPARSAQAAGAATKPVTGRSARQDAPPALDHTWPTGAASNSTSTSSAASPASAPAAASTPENAGSPSRAEDRTAPEPPVAPEPPQKTYEELVVSADSVIGLQTETPISSERARVEDRVEARVTRDLKVGDKVALPAGSRVLGTVTQVERGGKFKERARLGIRFHTIVLADGTRLPISTETIYRYGAAPGNESAAKIGGGGAGGAIIGAILGGAKGAVVGGMAGAGAGAAVVAAGDRNAATLPPGTPLTVRLQSPVTVTSEK